MAAFFFSHGASTSSYTARAKHVSKLNEHQRHKLTATFTIHVWFAAAAAAAAAADGDGDEDDTCYYAAWREIERPPSKYHYRASKWNAHRSVR